MAVERILDLEDPRLDEYRRVREPELVMKRGRFIAEGRLVVERLLCHSRFSLCSVLLAESKLGSVPVPEVVPTYVLPQALMDQLVGFPIHRGVLAVGDRCEDLSAVELLASLPPRATVLVLEGVSNHDNVGGIFRNAAGFGAHAVLLDPKTADPLYRKAIRVSLGTVLSVPFARAEPWPAALSVLRSAGFQRWALTPAAGASDLLALGARGARLPDRVAWLLGTEGTGLSEGALSECEAKWKIPMSGGIDSLNVAVAGAVALFAEASARLFVRSSARTDLACR